MCWAAAFLAYVLVSTAVLGVNDQALFAAVSDHPANGFLGSFEYVRSAASRPVSTTRDAHVVREVFGVSGADRKWFDVHTATKTFTFLLEPYSILHPNAKLTIMTEGLGEPQSTRLDAQLLRGRVIKVLNTTGGQPTLLNNSAELTTSSAVFLVQDKLPVASVPLAGNILLDSSQDRLHMRVDTNLLDAYVHVEGTFTLGEDTYHIADIQGYNAQRRSEDIAVPDRTARIGYNESAEMIIYRDADKSLRSLHDNTTTILDSRCGSDDMFGPPLDLIPTIVPKFNTSLNGTSTHFESQKSTASGCPSAKKIVYIGLVLDCNYIQRYQTVSLATKQAIKIVATVSQLYESQFNLQIGLIEVVALESCYSTSPSTNNTNQATAAAFNRVCSDNYTIYDRLDDLSYWRGSWKNTDAGTWHSLSTCNTGATIGLAWKSAICRTNAIAYADTTRQKTAYFSGAGVIGASVSISSDAEWVIVAHELGHNFGASHDCTSSSVCSNNDCCPCTSISCTNCINSYIMNPYSKSGAVTFSPCSIGEVCGNYPSITATCAQEPGSKTVVTMQECGNGVVEGSEECDCGGSLNCLQSQCCNSDCTLKRPSAVCDDNSDICCKNCQIVPSSAQKICRDVGHSCDLAETCDGTNKTCPTDILKSNGEVCVITKNNVNTTATCVSGVCTTRSLECQSKGIELGYGTSLSGTVVAECPNYFSGQCKMHCVLDTGACKLISSMYIDGTLCGKNGVCTNGVCSNPELFSVIASWVVENMYAAIAIAIAILATLFLIIRRCCRLRSSRKPAYGQQGRV